MSVKSDKQHDGQGQAARLFRYVPRVVLLLFAVLIVIFLAWAFLGGASVSSTRFIPSKPVPHASPQPAEDVRTHKYRSGINVQAEQPAGLSQGQSYHR